MTCPVEEIIVNALERAGIRYATEDEDENPSTLDFYLPDSDLYIEVKQFHSGRIARQTSVVTNVIVIQGRKAAEWFASMLTDNASAERGKLVESGIPHFGNVDNSGG